MHLTLASLKEMLNPIFLGKNRKILIFRLLIFLGKNRKISLICNSCLLILPSRGKISRQQINDIFLFLPKKIRVDIACKLSETVYILYLKCQPYFLVQIRIFYKMLPAEFFTQHTYDLKTIYAQLQTGLFLHDLCSQLKLWHVFNHELQSNLY